MGVRFRARLELNGKTATGFEVPADAVAELDAGKKPAVKVTLGDYTYRSTIASRGGRYLLGVSADNRAAAGVTAGDDLDVELELDTTPREVAVPGDFQAALDAAPDAKRFFEGPSFSQKQWFVLPIEEAKKPETRERRIAKAVERLSEGRASGRDGGRAAAGRGRGREGRA